MLVTLLFGVRTTSEVSRALAGPSASSSLPGVVAGDKAELRYDSGRGSLLTSNYVLSSRRAVVNVDVIDLVNSVSHAPCDLNYLAKLILIKIVYSLLFSSYYSISPLVFYAKFILMVPPMFVYVA